MMGGQIVVGHAVQIIADADFQFLESVEHVQFGQRNAGHARYRKRLPHQHGVKPAAAALTPGDRAEFMTAFAKPLADIVVQFGGERSGSDARGIGLGNSEYIAGAGWSDARTTRCGTGNRVRAGNKWIGAVIDIEQHALRAFEQYALAVAPRLVEAFPDRLGILQHRIGNFLQIIQQPLPVNRRLAKTGAQGIMMGAQPIELWSEVVEMGKIADPDRAPADLVFIGGADAAPGGADLALAAGVLAHGVEIAMDRQDQGAGFGNAEIVGVDGDALAFQLPDLVA